MMFAMSSPAFANNSSIPKRHTSEGENVSPAIEWSGVPQKTRSFALIVDDPDAPDPRAPQRTWVHWVLYDIPAEAHALSEDAMHLGLPAGSRCGLNDWNELGYGGPSPPVGRHRYFHRLYALDVLLGDLRQPTKGRLLAAMKGHVLAEAQVIGTYQMGQ